MLDAFSIIVSAFALQSTVALAAALLMGRLWRLHGTDACCTLALAWLLWSLTPIWRVADLLVDMPGSTVPTWAGSVIVLGSVISLYALPPVLTVGIRQLTDQRPTSLPLARWTWAAVGLGLLHGIVMLAGAMGHEAHVFLHWGPPTLLLGLTLLWLAHRLWVAPHDRMRGARRWAAATFAVFGLKQLLNLPWLDDAPTMALAANLIAENFLLTFAAIGTIVLEFQREREALVDGAAQQLEAAREGERRANELATAMDAVPDGLVIADASLTVTRANTAFSALVARLGRGTVAPGFAMGQFARPEMREAWVTSLRQALDGHRVRQTMPLPIDGVVRTYDVQADPILHDGVADSVVVSIRDVSDEERRRYELAEREHYFRSLIERAADVIAAVRLDGTIQFVSPAVERVLGWRSSELESRQVLDLAHPDDVPMLIAALAHYRQDDTAPRTYTLKARRPDGRYAEVEVGTSAFDTVAGERLIIVNVRDLTDRRALEQELLQAQRLDSLGRLAGGVAHDFNNLLTAILAHANFAATDEACPPPVREELEAIESTARRAADLTRQLLTFARRERIEPRVFDVNERLRGLSKLLSRVVGETVTVEPRLAPEELRVRVDVSQFDQAIVNLVVNARDAMPRGGTVRLETQRIEAAEVLNGAAALRLTVSDTGTGMDAEVARQIFEPFFTTKAGGRGTGLGLASVYGTVTTAGGRISVASAPGAGATFEILLPLQEAPADTGQGEHPHPLLPSRARVLVAEDDQLVRHVVVRLLKRHAFEVVEASDGLDALERWKAGRGTIDLVLTDVQMPRMNGRALARALAREAPELPIVYMSGYDADAVAADPDAPDGPFINKPFTEHELLDGLQRALARADSDGAREMTAGVRAAEE